MVSRGFRLVSLVFAVCLVLPGVARAGKCLHTGAPPIPMRPSGVLAQTSRLPREAAWRRASPGKAHGLRRLLILLVIRSRILNSMFALCSCSDSYEYLYMWCCSYSYSCSRSCLHYCPHPPTPPARPPRPSARPPRPPPIDIEFQHGLNLSASPGWPTDPPTPDICRDPFPSLTPYS